MTPKDRKVDQVRIQTAMHVLRERTALTQTDLAELLGRAQPEVSMWEWGKERMPEPIRQQVFVLLQERLPDTYSRLTPEDLDHPWDDVLQDLVRRDMASDRGR